MSYQLIQMNTNDESYIYCISKKYCGYYIVTKNINTHEFILIE